jgi:hypothetical protein
MKPSNRNFEGLGRKKSCIPKGTTGKNSIGFKSFKIPTIFLHKGAKYGCVKTQTIGD